MTLLAMDLDKKPEKGTFAGFTLAYQNPAGKFSFIQNTLNFQGSDEITGSDKSPIQLFRWIHFPGSYQQIGMLTGDYIYFATPRYFDSNRILQPLDPSLTINVKINVVISQMVM
ncbi:MAG: hypothetical protein IPN67_19670 [Bacteroidales bacterium]|nr:hypothetical protein [Bacteroidales bacterium]